MQVNNKAFDKGFEEKIPQAILLDNIWGEQLMEVLNPELFNFIHTRQIVDLLKDHYLRYNGFPSVSLLESMILDQVSDEAIRQRCLKYVLNMKSNPLNGDIEYVKDRSLEFFRLQTVARCLSEEIVPRIERGENLEDIVSIFQNAVVKGTSKNIGYDYTEDSDERFLEDKYDKVPTGFSYLDAMLGGGIGNKRLFTGIGPAGAGKTHIMVNMGKGALMAPKEDGVGRVVVHYTLEIDHVDLARRYDAAITGVKINDVPFKKNQILDNLKDHLPPGARLIIKEYPMKSASVQTIKSHLSRLRLKDIIPDVIIIDYGDLLRAMEGVDGEKRHGLEAIWQDMKRLAQELEIPIITFTQTNRSGYADDLITPDQVSEDFSKIMTSDIILTVARNLEQKQLGIGKALLAKNRQDKDGQIFGWSINTETCQIDMFELDQIEDSEDRAEEDTASKLEKFLSKKGRR